MTDKRKDPLVSEGDGWAWPWERRKDVGAGTPTLPSRAAAPKPAPVADDPEMAELEAIESAEAAERRPAPPPDPATTYAPAYWKTLLCIAVILPFLLFHGLAFLADIIGEPRIVLDRYLSPLPLGDRLFGAAVAWQWLPSWVAFIAVAMRLRAVTRAGRDGPGAAMLALIAFCVELGFWLFVGLKAGGYTAQEQADLILLMKIEGVALFGLFVLLAPTGKKRLGQTDADFNGD